MEAAPGVEDFDADKAVVLSVQDDECLDAFGRGIEMLVRPRVSHWPVAQRPKGSVAIIAYYETESDK